MNRLLHSSILIFFLGFGVLEYSHAVDAEVHFDAVGLFSKLSAIEGLDDSVSVDEINGFVKSVIAIPDRPEMTSWNQDKYLKLKMLIILNNIISHQKDKNFDFEDVPVFHVEPPDGLGLAPGVRPETIENPSLRREYEARIRENADKARKFKEQLQLRRVQSGLMNYTSKYIGHYFNEDDEKDVKNLLRNNAPDLMNEIFLDSKGE